MKLHLELSTEDFELLHRSLSLLRSTSTTAKVNRQALETLLRDHSTLLAYHRIEG